MEILDDEPHDKYSILERLGEGAFGEVRLGLDKTTGRHVALKYVRIATNARHRHGAGGLPRAVFRELESLRQLHECPYIVKLLACFPNETNLCLVLEYLPSDLSEVIRQAPPYIPAEHVKCYARQLLSALAFCHAHRVIHRDIKPSNILLSRDGRLKLADFGLARVLSDDGASSAGGVGDLSHQVATRWYRPPEILFASRSYSLSADMWSAGAVIAELITLSPLFPGNNDIDQMFRVFQIMGSPDPVNWPGVERLPDFNKVSFPDLKPLDMHALIMPHADAEDVAFLARMLCLDPAKRATAAEALSDAYFSECIPLPCSPAELTFYPRKGPSSGQAQGSRSSDEIALSRPDGGGGGAAEIEARVQRVLDGIFSLPLS